jgi:hypothetical protein
MAEQALAASSKITNWGDYTEAEVTFSDVFNKDIRREAPKYVSVVELPYGLTVKQLQKCHTELVTMFGNRITNPVETVHKILVNPTTLEGKIVWVINGPTEKGPSDADLFATRLSKMGFVGTKEVVHQIFAFLLSGFDEAPFPECEHFKALSEYSTNFKSVIEVLNNRLEKLSCETGGKFVVMESHSLVLKVQVVTPVSNKPVAIIHTSSGTTKQVVKHVPTTTVKVVTNPSSYAGKTSGGGAGAPVVVPPTPSLNKVETKQEPAFDAVLLAEILSDLAPYVGKSSEELSRMKTRGTLPAAVLCLLKDF